MPFSINGRAAGILRPAPTYESGKIDSVRFWPTADVSQSGTVRSYEHRYFIRNSSGFLPLATASAIHLGWRPRPVQVCEVSLGF